MKLLDDIILNELDGQYVVVDVRDSGDRFNGIIKLNETGAFVAKQLQNNTTMDEIVAAMMEQYEVAEEVARVNAVKVIEAFRKTGLLEE